MIRYIYYLLFVLTVASSMVNVGEVQTGTLEQHADMEILEEYAGKYEENSDMTGYIYLPNDVCYYADHNFNKEKSKEGLPFLNRYSLLGEQGISLMYGHHLKSGRGFTVLKHYLEDEGYLEKNRHIRIDTLYDRQEYEIVAVVLTSLNESFKYYNYVGQLSEQEFEEWKEGLQGYCVKGSLDDVCYEDVVMELSTCYYHKDDGRLVVILKAV